MLALDVLFALFLMYTFSIGAGLFLVIPFIVNLYILIIINSIKSDFESERPMAVQYRVVKV
jgi:hypothetical protein